MEERPPSRPRVAWEEKAAPRERKSPPEPYEVTMVEPLEMDVEQLPIYRQEKAIVDFIQAFVRCPEEDTKQRMTFLESVYMLIRIAKAYYLKEGLDVFCRTYELADHVKVVLEKEPSDTMSTALRRKAMFAIAELSSVDRVLEGKEKSLLEACFSRVLSLPPKEEMQGLDTDLYEMTLETMDTMLMLVVLNSPVTRMSELLQMIFQMLLEFTDSETVAVQERALDRIKKLCDLVANHATLEFGTDAYGPVYQDLQIPVLGTLLGRLLLFYSSEERTRFPASEALSNLQRFVHKQKSRPVSKNKGSSLRPITTSSCCTCLPTTIDFAREFSEHLTPSETTDVLLVAIEALRDSSTFDKRAARNMLALVMRYPSFWLVDVPKVMSCIYENLKHITTASARQSVESLLLALTDVAPIKVALSLLKFSPTGDSNGRATWEVMLSIPQTLVKILRELLNKLQGSPVTLAAENAYILHLARMAFIELQAEDFGDSSQTHSSLVTASQLLRCLSPLSERPDMARKMQVLLPHLMELLQDGHVNVKMNVLVIFKNVMPHLERKKASPIAAQLAQKLLPVFDAESTQLRELSISLFRDVVQAVGRKDKKRVKKQAQRGLLPLFFHAHEETGSVCEASREALFAAAELLHRKELKNLMEPQEMWTTVERSLLQDRRRVVEYLEQSLPYLKNAQATLRETAVRFIGLGAQQLRGHNEDKLGDICNALKLLATDAEPTIQALATQTLLILERPKKKPRSRWSLPTLSFGFCRGQVPW